MLVQGGREMGRVRVIRTRMNERNEKGKLTESQVWLEDDFRVEMLKSFSSWHPWPPSETFFLRNKCSDAKNQKVTTDDQSLAPVFDENETKMKFNRFSRFYIKHMQIIRVLFLFVKRVKIIGKRHQTTFFLNPIFYLLFIPFFFFVKWQPFSEATFQTTSFRCISVFNPPF